MESTELNRIIQLFVATVALCGLGGYVLVRREAVVEAMLESNDVLWGRLGFKPRAGARTMSRIMIPLMGLVFLGPQENLWVKWGSGSWPRV